MRSMFVKLFLGFWLTMVLGGAVSVAVMSTFRHLSFEVMKTDFTNKIDANMARLIVLLGQTAQEMYLCGGPAEYEKYVNGLATEARITIILVGDDNRTITGDKIAKEYTQIADNARNQAGVALSKKGETLIVAENIPVPSGGARVVIGTHTFGPPLGGPPPKGRGGLSFGPPPGPPPFEENGFPVFAPPAGPPPVVRKGFPDFGPPPPREKGGFLAGLIPPFWGKMELVRAVVMLIVVSGVCYFLARSLTMPIRRLQKTARQIAEGDYSARVGRGLENTGNEIAELGRDFDIMVERTEKVITAQKRLLRDISHELRSPLARLNVALALAKKKLNAEDDGSLQKIGQEADRINELIGHLLILTRLESGSGVYASEPVDVMELLRDVAADVNFEVAGLGRGVRISSAAAVVVSGSRELLRRALENIVRNAAQYTADHSLVDVAVSVPGKEAHIVVTDFGPGVPERDLPHIFQPFYRVAEARERRSGGVGIGLAIAEQAVMVHGGRVRARNGGEGRGLMVEITLPLRS